MSCVSFQTAWLHLIPAPQVLNSKVIEESVFQAKQEKDFPYYVINNVGLTHVLLHRCCLESKRRVPFTGEIYETLPEEEAFAFCKAFSVVEKL